MTQIKEREIVSPVRETPPPARPSRPSRSTAMKKWRNRFIVLIMVIAAGVAGTAIVRSQESRASELDLGELMLTSQPIPVETSLPGLVTAVDVVAGQRVTTGQIVGSIRVTTTNSKGKPVLTERNLVAPRSGVVVDDPLTIGATLEPGTGFVVLYDPADLTLVTDVPLTYLHEVAPGMLATVTAPGVPGTLHAVLKRAVPRIGTSQNDVAADHLELVFVAQHPSQVARLIPGLQFTGSIDTSTGRSGTQPVVFVH